MDKVSLGTRGGATVDAEHFALVTVMVMMEGLATLLVPRLGIGYSTRC